nr:MAG TPA: hypothetical protein [Caudoviricetes sp.]
MLPMPCNRPRWWGNCPACNFCKMGFPNRCTGRGVPFPRLLRFSYSTAFR